MCEKLYFNNAAYVYSGLCTHIVQPLLKKRAILVLNVLYDSISRCRILFFLLSSIPWSKYNFFLLDHSQHKTLAVLWTAAFRISDGRRLKFPLHFNVPIHNLYNMFNTNIHLYIYIHPSIRCLLLSLSFSHFKRKSK